MGTEHTLIEIYIAAVAGNATCLFAAWIWYQPRGEVITRKDRLLRPVAIGAMIGLPLVYVLFGLGG